MYERFEIILAQKGIKASHVAKATGIPPSTFTDWKKGRSKPKADKIKKIADYLNVNKDWLEGVSDNPVVQTKKGNIINVLGDVAAGIPIDAIENIIDTEEIPQSLAKTGDFFGLRIKGDSMQPTICEGDTVIVKKQNDAESGDIVIALVNGDSATCKKLVKYDDGISLVSFNPQYEPMIFNKKDMKEKPVTIIGKVVENRRKF